ncbi:ATPase domain-containing protein [Paeniroseomonas aquatica]
MADPQQRATTPEDDPPHIDRQRRARRHPRRWRRRRPPLPGGGPPRRRQNHPGAAILFAGLARHETVLYISLSETERELRLVAKRHGWSLDGIAVFELVPPEASLDPNRELTVFHPAEMELSETTQMVFDRVAALNPSRIVFDSLSELRLLAQNSLRYRRQILALKHFFTGRCCTVLMLDDMSSKADDLQLHSIAHGVVLLEQVALDYGGERRRLRVVKMRGMPFRGGFHDFTIRRGGLEIYPRLVAAEHRQEVATAKVSSGRAELDAMVGGGLERGSSALLLGAAGVGKSSVALTYAIAAAERGEKTVFYAFDEGRATILSRCAALGLPLQDALDAGLIHIQQIDPAELSPANSSTWSARR